MYATTSVNHIGPIYLSLPLFSIVFVTFVFYLKVPLKNIKRVIPEEYVFDVIHKYHNIMDNHSCSKTTYYQVRLHVHGIFVLPYFLQVFYISASRSDSDSEPQQASLQWLYNSINIHIFVLHKFSR